MTPDDTDDIGANYSHSSIQTCLFAWPSHPSRGIHSTGSPSMSTPCWLFQLVFNSLFYNLFASTQIWMLSSSECRTIHVSDLGAYRCRHSSPLHWPHYLHGCRQSTKRGTLLVGQQSHCTMAFGVVALWQSYDSNRFRSCAIRISRSPQRTSFTK